MCEREEREGIQYRKEQRISKREEGERSAEERNKMYDNQGMKSVSERGLGWERKMGGGGEKEGSKSQTAVVSLKKLWKITGIALSQC